MKIRAWHKVNKEWISFEELFKTDQHWQNPFGREDLILVRSTELHDKNGKEIWEGDIVKVINYNDVAQSSITHDKLFRFRHEEIGAIYWHSQQACFCFIEKESASGVTFSWIYDRMEVLGNLYENPELLK